jgi:hypothetical protein
MLPTLGHLMFDTAVSMPEPIKAVHACCLFMNDVLQPYQVLLGQQPDAYR